MQLPTALFTAIHAGRVYAVNAPMHERVKLWREDYRHFEDDPPWLIERLRPLRPLVGAEEFDAWQRLADTKQMPALFQRLMENHYDPAYGRSISKHYPTLAAAEQLHLLTLDPAALKEIANRLIFDHATVALKHPAHARVHDNP